MGMSVTEYKEKIIHHFQSGDASVAAWLELAEIILVASENGDAEVIDQEALTAEELKDCQG